MITIDWNFDGVVYFTVDQTESHFVDTVDADGVSKRDTVAKHTSSNVYPLSLAQFGLLCWKFSDNVYRHQREKLTAPEM
jgi:hypothetical protein